MQRRRPRDRGLPQAERESALVAPEPAEHGAPLAEIALELSIAATSTAARKAA